MCYGFFQSGDTGAQHTGTNSHIAVPVGCRDLLVHVGFGPPSIVGIWDSNFRTPLTQTSARGWRGRLGNSIRESVRRAVSCAQLK